MLRIHPDEFASKNSFTHIGYGWVNGSNQEIAELVVEEPDEIIRRIRGAGKTTADTL
jgi:hypothetical protein